MNCLDRPPTFSFCSAPNQITSGTVDENEGLHRSKQSAKYAGDAEGSRKPFTAEKILVAVGTYPARRPDFVFDGTHIIDR